MRSSRLRSSSSASGSRSSRRATGQRSHVESATRPRTVCRSTSCCGGPAAADSRARRRAARAVPGGPAVEVEPVLRLRGGVGRLEGESGITLLGLPPSSLPQLDGWREDERGASPQELATRIEATRPSRNGPRLPARPDELRCRRPAGDRRDSPPRSRAERPASPPRARGTGACRGRSRPRRAAGGSQARDRARDAAAGARRRRGPGGRRGRPALVPRSCPGALDGWAGFGGATLDGGHSPLHAHARRGRHAIRPRQPVDREPVPVLATPRLARAAGAGGLLPLQIAGERLPVRVVGTIRRMPGVDGQAIVGDAEALGSAIDLQRPGAGRVNEIWLRPPRPSRAGEIERRLAAKPFHVLETTSRRALEAEARRDPIAHGTLLALARRGCGRARAGARRDSCSPCSATCATSAASSSTSRRRASARGCSGAIVRLRALTRRGGRPRRGSAGGALRSAASSPTSSVSPPVRPRRSRRSCSSSTGSSSPLGSLSMRLARRRPRAARDAPRCSPPIACRGVWRAPNDRAGRGT